jgi:hypothetical protein
MRHAIFTIIQDEPFFFPLWHKYYREHYPSRHMYVLYHPLPAEEQDPTWLGKTLVLTSTNLVRIFRDESFDHSWLREQVERFAGFLLGSYDTVTFTEVDEIIAIDPTKSKERNLTTWLDAWYCRDQAAARCTGYEVIHRFDKEPAVDREVTWRPDGRVLKDRGWWYPSSLYSKTLIWRVQPHWELGFHQALTYFGDATGRHAALELPCEPDLMLLHLHKVDYPLAVERWQRTANRNWSKTDLKDRIGFQNRFPNEAKLREWWYQDIVKHTTGAIVSMPAEMRDIV